MNNLLLTILFFVASPNLFASGAPASFQEIARNSDGIVKLMSQNQAFGYCAKLGNRLPSARELTQLAMSLGTRGIVDSCGSDDYCYQVKVKNIDGSSDSFKFSYAGYQRPPADNPDSNRFWSSSVGSPGASNGIVLYGDEGYVEQVSRDSQEAVRCVSGRQGSVF